MPRDYNVPILSRLRGPTLLVSHSTGATRTAEGHIPGLVLALIQARLC